MKFFIDTANIDEIKEAHSMGMVDGVTTNPSLIAKEGRVFEDVIKEICEIAQGPVSAEVVANADSTSTSSGGSIFGRRSRKYVPTETVPWTDEGYRPPSLHPWPIPVQSVQGRHLRMLPYLCR